MIKFILNISLYIFYDAFKFIMNWTNRKQDSKLNIFKAMKFTSKPKFSHLLLSITFDDKLGRSHLDILDLGTWQKYRGHHEKYSNLNNICWFFQAFDQNNYGFSISQHWFGPLYHACTKTSINKSQVMRNKIHTIVMIFIMIDFAYYIQGSYYKIQHVVSQDLDLVQFYLNSGFNS